MQIRTTQRLLGAYDLRIKKMEKSKMYVPAYTDLLTKNIPSKQCIM